MAQVIGTVTWCQADTASENCSGDTGNSLCSNTINGLLALRVMGWQNPDANPGCCGRLSLQQALALIVSRQGTDVAGQTLTKAISIGMPQEQAAALATAHGIPLDSTMPTLRERFAEAAKKAQARKAVPVRLDLRNCAACKARMLATMITALQAEGSRIVSQGNSGIPEA